MKQKEEMMDTVKRLLAFMNWYTGISEVAEPVYSQQKYIVSTSIYYEMNAMITDRDPGKIKDRKKINYTPITISNIRDEN